MELIIYIDGACRFNPGPAGIGVLVQDSEGNTKREISMAIGHATNNIAEWSAYLKALETAKEMKAKHLSVYTDSKLLEQQVRGNFKIKNENLILLANKARSLVKFFETFQITHIPREKNTKADKLSKQAVASLPPNTKKKQEKKLHTPPLF
ncbi:ribonuclease HI family protein [Elusimicrobiota bacterium]